MCGRVIQGNGPIRYAIVEGIDVRDSRVHNYPPRWNAASSQDLLVIRRNHDTGIVSLDLLRWGLIPHWCQDPKEGREPINAKCEMLLGSACLLVVVLTHVAEAFHIFAVMGWGLPNSAGHYLDLASAILALVLLPLGFVAGALSRR